MLKEDGNIPIQNGTSKHRQYELCAGCHGPRVQSTWIAETTLYTALNCRLKLEISRLREASPESEYSGWYSSQQRSNGFSASPEEG